MTVMQAMQTESAKQTAAMQAESAKFTSAVENLRSEIKKDNETLAQSLTAKFKAAYDKIREDFNIKLNSETLIVSERVDNVRKDNGNEISQLSSIVDQVYASVRDRINVYVTQTRKQVDVHRQEVLKASRSMLANINEHREQTEAIISNIKQQVTKTREYVHKFSTVPADMQQFRRNADEISKLNAKLGELQNKLAAGNPNNAQSADSGNVIVTVNTADQLTGTDPSVETNTITNTNGINVCSNSACHDSNSVITQTVNSDICKNVNATSDVQGRRVGLRELTLTWHH
jgi:hypothetical protein